MYGDATWKAIEPTTGAWIGAKDSPKERNAGTTEKSAARIQRSRNCLKRPLFAAK